MQAGFAMLEAGSVRSKNVKNVMLKNLLDACGAAVGFYLIGWGVAYGGDDASKKTFMGTTAFGLVDNEGDMYHNWYFQFAFAATAATIVAGTVAERCTMTAYMVYSFVLTSFVYPVIAHSIWAASGFLSAFNEEPFADVGVVDFAGSGVVHLTGGACALVAAIILGPRMGRFYDELGNALPTPKEMPGHSTSLQMLGTMILWCGWYG
jgi:Amt family ammonium transporter